VSNSVRQEIDKQGERKLNNYFMKIRVSIFLFILLTILLQFEILNAQDFECPIATSENIKEYFPEITVILNDFRKTSNNKFCNYEGSKSDLMKTLEAWPDNEFKMIISTSSEIEKMPNRMVS